MRKRHPAAKAIGERVRAIRKSQGLSIEKLAERADVTASFLSGVERGTQNPSIETLMKVARALEVEPALIFERLPGSEEPTLRMRIRKGIDGLPSEKLRVVLRIVDALRSER